MAVEDRLLVRMVGPCPCLSSVRGRPTLMHGKDSLLTSQSTYRETEPEALMQQMAIHILVQLALQKGPAVKSPSRCRRRLEKHT